MDRRAVVDQTEASSATAMVEQAIFTSIRSPMGQGYRLVAASAAITADEKREIVQCAPSHGSLCDPAPAATGLASYELRSGRRCIFISQNAGTEQTARGGCRIHTHVLVMEQAAFRQFDWDPLRVQVAALPAIDPEVVRTLPPRLEPLLLRSKPAGAAKRELGGAARLATSDADHLTYILSVVLEGRRVLAVGAPTPQETLRRLLAATPRAVRQRLSLSYGLKFSPFRRFQLIFADAERRETERILRDHDVGLLHWDSPPPRASSLFDVWLRFARRHWKTDRDDDLDRLAAQLTQEQSAQMLARIATLSTDIERVRDADPTLLAQLVRKHSLSTPESKTQGRLLADFRKAAEARQACLRRAEQESSAESEAPIQEHAS